MSTDLRRGVSPRLSNDERERYGPTSHGTERALFHGYSSVSTRDPVIVGTPCACGGWVQADPDAPARGVAQHNSTGRHLAWRSANGFDLPLEAR